jgi:hypothetical protein
MVSGIHPSLPVSPRRTTRHTKRAGHARTGLILDMASAVMSGAALAWSNWGINGSRIDIIRRAPSPRAGAWCSAKAPWETPPCAM